MEALCEQFLFGFGTTVTDIDYRNRDTTIAKCVYDSAADAVATTGHNRGLPLKSLHVDFYRVGADIQSECGIWRMEWGKLVIIGGAWKIRSGNRQ